jgi:hypothetical protein
MPLLEFESCRERIGRAKIHAKAFAQAWNDFVEDEPYSAVVHVDDDGTGGIWAEPVYDALPSVFSLELGEFLYNLRAALDHCVYAAAIVESGQNPPPNERALEFPICDTAEQFESAAWKIEPLSGHRRQIIKDVQPYNAVEGLTSEKLIFSPHRAMAILNDWARKDRHRRLHVMGSWASNVSPMVIIPSGTRIAEMTILGSGILEHQSKVASFRIEGWEPGMKIQANPNLSIDITLDEIPPPAADNDTLGDRLRMMEIWVGQIVGAFEESLIADRAGKPWPPPQAAH